MLNGCVGLPLTGLPIGYSVLVALPIGYSVLVALTGPPIGYSVIVYNSQVSNTRDKVQ